MAIEAAKAQVEASDAHRRKYLKRFYHVNWEDSSLYDLTVNTARLECRRCSRIDLYDPGNKMNRSHWIGQPRFKQPEFSHPTEVMFAQILDFYGIEWVYEPRTFPLEWDEDNNVTLALRPIFTCPSRICISN
jgi:hypothetical protein